MCPLNTLCAEVDTEIVPTIEKKKEKRKIEDNNTHIFGTTSVLLHCWLAGLV
jgi:hypothetical protein